MGKNNIEPEARAYVCSDCFGKLASFMLTNPALIKNLGIIYPLTIHPVEEGVAVPCKYCNSAIATGYIPCIPPKNRIVECGERV